MSDVVVDSSVVAKWILPESDSAQAHTLITQVALKGGTLFALDLVFSEVSNAIWKRHHRKLITLDEAQSSVDELLSSPIRVKRSTPLLLRRAFQIATTHQQTIYDALFVALAEELDLLGVTADKPLHNAVHRAFPKIVLLRSWSP